MYVCMYVNKKDPANGREALIETALDEAEGADILMVKPGTYIHINVHMRTLVHHTQ